MTSFKEEETELFNITEVVKEWAINAFFKTAIKEQKKLDASEIDFRFIWDDVVSWNDKPSFFEIKSMALPKSHILFSTTFRNNTNTEQEYSFRTERSTRSTAELEITKGFSARKEIGLKLQLPEQILEASAGFSKEISVSSAARQTIDEELTWGVDSRIVVQPYNLAEAEVKITEEKLTTKFRVKTFFQGKIRVVCTDIGRDNAFLKYIEGDIAEIIAQRVSNKQFMNKSACEHVSISLGQGTRKVVCVETEGRCNFRFGIKQVVEVKQLPFTING